jgi:DUF4097 and DUF4098 domain-containing protein YvlB
MMKPLRGTLLALICLCAVGLATAGERHFEKKFTVAPGGTLTLKTDEGSVRVSGTSGSEVSVVADMRGKQRDVDDFEITAEQSGSGVDVIGRSKQSHHWFWNSVDLEVHYTVTVPASYNVRLNTSGGDLEIRDLKGTVRGETSGGTISVSGIQGDVDANTSGGDVRAENVTGALRMETSGGDISLSAIVGQVDVSTSGGSIRINGVDGGVKAETSGGNVEVRIKGSNRGVYAETSGGNIDILIGKNVAASIDAETSGGEVVCDLPITLSGKMDPTRVRGNVNGGGNTIHAHTSGGNVHIRTLD